MDQIQREKVIEKLGKIKELAERGEGGEKETAMRMYEELCRKYDISDAEAENCGSIKRRLSCSSLWMETRRPKQRLKKRSEAGWMKTRNN